MVASIEDLPKDVLWLVLRHVIISEYEIYRPDWWWYELSFYCKSPGFNYWGDKTQQLMLQLSMTCKLWKRVLLSKCRFRIVNAYKYPYGIWSFNKGTFE
jgi:hypothetical protein